MSENRPDLTLASLSAADVLAIAAALERHADWLRRPRNERLLRESPHFVARADRAGTLALTFRFAAMLGTTYEVRAIPGPAPIEETR